MRSLAPLVLPLIVFLQTMPVCAQEAAAPSNGPPPPQAPQQSEAGKPEQLPPVTVIEEQEKKAPAEKAPKAKGSAPPITAAAANTSTASSAAAGSPQLGPLGAETQALDSARDNLLTQIGTNSFSLNREALEAMPEGTNAPLGKVLLQAPGVTQDSVASGQIHVRNEHANVQYRINGIILPDGVSGFSQVLDTAFVGNLSLITGALPAEYGLRTSGLIDIQTRSGAFDGGGSVGIYGGQRETVTPSFEYGGTEGQTQYFVTGRYFGSDEGIENPTSSMVPIHDNTEQGAFFSYVSTLLDSDTRLSWISGSTINWFQIPNSPDQDPVYQPFGIATFNSALLNERQFEQNCYDVIALQKKSDTVDWQLAYYARYSDLHFTPDVVGDLVFNGVASDVQRQSFANGLQGDGSYRLDDRHTLRAGFVINAEQTEVGNASLVLPTATGAPPCNAASLDNPCNVAENVTKLGWLLGAYLQDEWKITDKLTFNVGLRFDQMYQFVDANQWSPRASLVYKPFAGTTLHAGYARYFTPPSQVLAAPTNVAAVDNTTQASQTCGGQSPVVEPPCGLVLPEHSHYFDVGLEQRIFPGLKVGVDGYYKIARDLLDDGQFGAALVLDGFNYAKAYNEGIELKADYNAGNLRAYGNLAIAQQKGTNIVSNQFLFSADEIGYIASHYIFTDHSQTMTASAGLSYTWNKHTRFTADMIYGSGLRSGDFNLDHVPGYAQVNVGVSHEFNSGLEKPATIRFDVINLFDKVYEIRDGSGIGVFAPQFGPRREFLAGLSQKF
ncbi:MAG TPA: TonB-dependent receptor [Hyphomicrobium sp.]|nr:TonB-dependent receptor [Hyphomicrobium sp.]